MKRNKPESTGRAVWAAFLFLGIAMPGLANEPDTSAKSKASCVSWKAEARFVGVAYNHLVHLHNKCEYNAECEVTTDVNPKGSKVQLPKDKKTTVMTFRGSPSREFKAKVTCVRKE